MGCGSSKTSVKKLDPSKPPPIPKSAKSERGSSAKSNSSEKKPRSADLSIFGRKKRPQSGSSMVTVGQVKVRGNSATSNKSADSGIGSDSRRSPDRVVKSANLKTKPLHVDNLLLQNPSPPPRADEKKILSSLREEGLLTAAETKTATAGLCYEVPLGELQKARKLRPPARLQKLERHNQLELSRQQIKDKLEKAERRRKKREHEKIERNREKDAKNLEVKLALLEIEKIKEKELRKHVDDNLNKHLTRKVSQIEQVVQKQKEHELKVDTVRARKDSFPSLDFADTNEAKAMNLKSNNSQKIDEIPVAAAKNKYASIK